MKRQPGTEQISSTEPGGQTRRRPQCPCREPNEPTDGLPTMLGNPFSTCTLAEVSGCLHYDGPARTLEQMEQAIRNGVAEAGKIDARNFMPSREVV